MEDRFEFLDETDAHEGINIIPLINVSLVLVLVFMVTSPYFVKDLIPLTLPEAVTTETEDRENLTISVSPEYGFAINEIPVTRQALPIQLSQTMDRTKIKYILIRADERTPHGEIEDLLKLCKQLGARRIAFATNPKVL